MAASSDSESAAHALYRAAHTHLTQRGYSNINARLNCAQPGDAERPREEKLNEMVGREAMRKATRSALQLFISQPIGYGEQWAQLAQWLAACPAWQQRELMPMYFPMFVHCYIALVARSETETASRIIQVGPPPRKRPRGSPASFASPRSPPPPPPSQHSSASPPIPPAPPSTLPTRATLATLLRLPSPSQSQIQRLSHDPRHKDQCEQLRTLQQPSQLPSHALAQAR